MSMEDVNPISYLEGKIYPENLKDHIGNLQHAITASILNNTLKNRGNISFTRYDEKEKMRGYLLAYQGIMKSGELGIYISGFAIEKKFRGDVGLEMIRNRIALVKEKYTDLPVFTRAREYTSYHMIKALAQKNGYIIVEDLQDHENGEAFHRIMMSQQK